MTRADRLWATHDRAWRDPAQVASQWEDAGRVDPALLRRRTRGPWWELLAETGTTLIVTREYEHLMLGLAAPEGRPRVSFMAMPHPSGVAFDRARRRVHVASTRNPNQVFELAPVTAMLGRADKPADPPPGRPLVPVASRAHPGALYIHDLAMIGGELHANAVGENAVVRLDPDGGVERVWWPRAVERRGRPDVSRNHIQLNSIAAGKDIESSFFTASAERPGKRRPGHLDFPVDRRGVLFSGRTREPVARGLTRPHSARLRRGTVWVDDSGYGELVAIRAGEIERVAQLPGWTRGLCFAGGIAFVGTSRVIPRFRRYAPGLDVDRSICGVHAVELSSGRTLASIVWPAGNQIFAVEAVPNAFSLGFPFPAGRRRQSESLRRLFFGFQVPPTSTRTR